MVLAGAVAHIGVDAIRRTRDERARLRSLATVAAAALREAPATMEPPRRGEVLRRLRQGDEHTGLVADRTAHALIAAGAADAVAIVDGSGEIARYWPTRGTPLPRLPVPPRGAGGRVGRLEETTVPTTLACVALGTDSAATADGFACVLSATPLLDGHPWVQGAWVATGMVAFGLLGYLAASNYLRRRVCTPLERVLAAGVEAGADPLLRREDEIGAIARRLNDLSAELQDAREDAQRLRHTLESTVTRETKQISTQLRRAERVAELDALTGLANRRYIHERLEGVFSEQRSRKVNLAIVMLDVDNFKPLNDQAGHAAGDALLRFVGELLRGSLREGDVGVRYGGDEFALVLVDVTGAQAREIAERIVRLFARQTAVAKLPAPVTLSAGVASLDEVVATSGAELLAHADDALYRSKRGGKNVVQAARN